MVWSAQPHSTLPLFSKTAHPHALFTLQWYLDNSLACLRRCVCPWVRIGQAHLLVSGWQEVSTVPPRVFSPAVTILETQDSFYSSLQETKWLNSDNRFELVFGTLKKKFFFSCWSGLTMLLSRHTVGTNSLATGQGHSATVACWLSHCGLFLA